MEEEEERGGGRVRLCSLLSSLSPLSPPFSSLQESPGSCQPTAVKRLLRSSYSSTLSLPTPPHLPCEGRKEGRKGEKKVPPVPAEVEKEVEVRWAVGGGST